jgi:hypothetical protein
MEIASKLKEQFGEQISLREVEPNIFQVYAPFFHEDGDMISMYIEKGESDDFRIRDYGNTLMRISYTFDIDSENKQNILSNIVKSNYGNIDDGELILKTDIQRIPQSIFQFSQLVSKVSNIDILRRDVVKSMFYDYLRDFIYEGLSSYEVASDIAPTHDKSLIVDYRIQSKTPLYIFGVNDNAKASKVVISCLSFQNKHLPFKSLVIHDDIDGLTKFNRNQVINAADKQFTTLDEFKTMGPSYIERVLAS